MVFYASRAGQALLIIPYICLANRNFSSGHVYPDHRGDRTISEPQFDGVSSLDLDYVFGGIYFADT